MSVGRSIGAPESMILLRNLVIFTQRVSDVVPEPSKGETHATPNDEPVNDTE